MIERVTYTTQPSSQSMGRYITVYAPDGSYVSRHINMEECTESALAHAQANEISGTYRFVPPEKHMSVQIIKTVPGIDVRGFIAEPATGRVNAIGFAANELAQSDQMNVSLLANGQASLTGPAPLAVHFDATGTTHVTDDAFREVGYYFDYNDEKGETWTYGSGDSKNVDRGGPLGAHVFETPGTYDVRVRARDAAGEIEDAQVVITVTDPDSVYSGTSTVVISTNTDTTGAPAGALLLTNQTSWPTWASDTRYLLVRGQNYRSFGDILFNDISDSQIGAIGSGAKPLVTNVYSQGTGIYSNLNFADLSAYTFKVYHQAKNIGAQRFDITEQSSGGFVIVGEGFSGQPSSWELAECAVISEFNWLSSVQSYCVFSGNSYKTAFIGCNCPTWGGEHGMRFFNFYKHFVAHNNLPGSGTGFAKHSLKLNGNGTTAFSGLNDGENKISQYGICADNVIGATDSDIGVGAAGAQIAPQNDTVPVIVRDVIYERNTKVPFGRTDAFLGGERLTIRGSPTYIAVTGNGYPGGVPEGSNGPYYINDTTPTTESPR